jgi:diguanylate cyclase (GGDEF)-like protein
MVNKAWRTFAARNPLPGPDALTHACDIAQNPHKGVGTNYLEVCDGATGSCAADAFAVAAGIRSVIRGDCSTFILEYPCHSPTEPLWFLVRVSRFDGDGPIRLVVAHENVTERRLAQDRLLHNSLHDALTGLPNRILFKDRVQRCIERGQREPHYRFAAMFLDLDGFKHINDSLGHDVGDKLLMEVAGRLRACLRGTDSLCRIDESATSTVARMGGDEFTILLDRIRGLHDAAIVAERIEAELTAPCTIDGHEVFVSASIGIVNGERSYRTADDLLRDADAAMYRAKTTGKGSYALFDVSLHQRAVARLTLESDLRRAIDRGELLLHYQPIVELATRERVGFEALIRWRRAGKLVSPADFVPVAEDTGMIVPIGAWVLVEACRQLQAWRAADPKMANVTMSVNLSCRQFADPDLVNRVRKVLKDTGIGAQSLKLEITESVVMEDTESAYQVLTDIKSLGVGIHMDDFGTGYSSLSCLNRFPLDGLKIDRSFIREISQKKQSIAILQAMVTLARTLGMKVVAEGVEWGEQVELLEGLDCQYVQGYYFSKPLAPDAAATFSVPPQALEMAA